jgi:hypothetical protein
MDELQRYLAEEALEDAPAAKAAWGGAIAWFARYLR